MSQNSQKIFRFITLILGGVVIYRFNQNMNLFESEMRKEKSFDRTKKHSQIELYKQIYNSNNDVEENSRFLQAASKEDKELINRILGKYDSLHEDEIHQEIKKLKNELDLLEDSKTTHQGIKLAKHYFQYQPSEEAISKMRDEYLEQKKKKKEDEKK